MILLLALKLTEHLLNTVINKNMHVLYSCGNAFSKVLWEIGRNIKKKQINYWTL